MVYRATEARPLACVRCKKQLPPVDIATCTCGTWVSAFAASEVLRPEELRHDPITRWWRVRAPCPICGDKMTLRGDEPGLFQGCDGHGFWIDADTVEHTGLARGVDLAAVERKRADDTRVQAATEERERAELDRARAREEKHRREGEVARMFVPTTKRAEEPAAIEDRPIEVVVAELVEQVRDLKRRVAELESKQK